MSNETLSLKGHKNEYEIIFHNEFGFKQILYDLNILLSKLYNDVIKINDQKKISFIINSNNLFLSVHQKNEINVLFRDYPLFVIERFVSSVISKSDIISLVSKNSIKYNSDVIRNGQVNLVEGNVLFMGDIHKGGILQATGNVYILGNVNGIISAGFPDNNGAVIVGNVSHAQQIRIADLVNVFEDGESKIFFDSVIYINDLHNFAYTKLENLKKIRPKIFAKIGGF